MKPKISIEADTYVEEPMEELKPYEQNYKKSEKNIDEEFDKCMDEECNQTDMTYKLKIFNNDIKELIDENKNLRIQLCKENIESLSLKDKYETKCIDQSNLLSEYKKEIELQNSVHNKLIDQIELLTNQNEELSNKLNKRNVIIDFLYTLVEASFVEGYYSRTLFSFLKDKYSHSKNSFKNSYITRRIEEIKSDNLD